MQMHMIAVNADLNKLDIGAKFSDFLKNRLEVTRYAFGQDFPAVFRDKYDVILSLVDAMARFS